MPSPRARIFIGSSSEGRDVARLMEAELDADLCDVVRWDVDVFEPGGYTLDSLATVAATVDFAVLIATPDDPTKYRGVETFAARDNVVLEFGLFAGALGRRRTYLLATDALMRLPTDVLGVTRLDYRPQATGRAAVTRAAIQVEERVRSLGLHERALSAAEGVALGSALDAELVLLCANAEAQGWTVKTNNRTTLRLLTPSGKSHALSKRQNEATREDLRVFVARLRADGLRVNSSLRRPVAESPHG